MALTVVNGLTAIVALFVVLISFSLSLSLSLSLSRFRLKLHCVSSPLSPHLCHYVVSGNDVVESRLTRSHVAAVAIVAVGV